MTGTDLERARHKAGLIPVAWGWQNGEESAAWPGEPDGRLRAGVTVAVCTCARPESLERFLGSLPGGSPGRLEVLIVDSSRDEASEAVVRRMASRDGWNLPIRYLRVAGRLRGLTRQRNVALDQACHELVAFFDDDIVLEVGALEAMESLHRRHDPSPVGVGALIINELQPPPARWRMRRWLGVVPNLVPGSYSRAGLSVPWRFLAPGSPPAEGDWLPGGATMWRTGAARATRFNEEFSGYGNGEDLEFSLRARKHGPLLMQPAARVQHLHEGAGRPGGRGLGYSTAVNNWRIHRLLPGRSGRDVLRFAYANAVDVLMQVATLWRHGASGRASYLAGYTSGLWDVLTGRPR